MRNNLLIILLMILLITIIGLIILRVINSENKGGKIKECDECKECEECEVNRYQYILQFKEPSMNLVSMNKKHSIYIEDGKLISQGLSEKNWEIELPTADKIGTNNKGQFVVMDKNENEILVHPINEQVEKFSRIYISNNGFLTCIEEENDEIIWEHDIKVKMNKSKDE